MLCPTCNTPNRDDAKFCKKCGHSFQTEATNTLAAAGQADTSPAAGEAPLEQTAAANPAYPEPAVATQISETPANDQVQAQAMSDISQAPTLILTPEQMMAYHSRRWQQEEEQEQAASGIADLPALISTPGPADSQGEQVQDVADMPTVLDSPPASGDEAIPPSPPPPVASDEGDIPPTSTEKDQVAETSAVDTSDVAHGTTEEEASESMQPSSDQPDTAEAAADFSTLAVGATVVGRYEITQVVSESEQERVYQVIDHEGYQRCWNCASEQNAQGDEFCMSCGAELLNAPYTLHEYPAKASPEADARVLHGTIVNTFIDHGHTYVIEQQQVAQNAFPDGVRLEAATHSDAGDIRRSEPNEDSTLVLMLQRVHESISEPMGVFIVADGLGGHDNGQVASRMTIALIAERMARELLAGPLASEKAGESAKPFDEDEYIALLKGAVEDANTALCQVNERDKTDMGSTITGFMIVGDHAYIINVGDSRTYMLRGGQLYKLTNDHSLVEQLVAGGLIEPDDVYTHPQRSQIFRSLGDKLNVQIDVFKQQLQPGDIMLSCSDGLWEMVRNPQIESMLSTAPDPQTASAQLIDAANANGGEDNISAVVVFVR
jgi:serine/threonine protein phosphatase PrpC/rRNA maturation endonuclease Nob1